MRRWAEDWLGKVSPEGPRRPESQSLEVQPLGVTAPPFGEEAAP